MIETKHNGHGGDVNWQRIASKFRLLSWRQGKPPLIIHFSLPSAIAGLGTVRSQLTALCAGLGQQQQVCLGDGIRRLRIDQSCFLNCESHHKFLSLASSPD